METDSTLSGIALAISIVLFGVASLVEASIGSVRRERLQVLVSLSAPGSSYLDQLRSLPMGATGALTLVRISSLASSLVSAAAVVIASMGINWLGIALVSLAVLAFLGIVHGIAVSLAARHGVTIALRTALLAKWLAWILAPILAFETVLMRKAMEPGNGANGAQEATAPEIGIPLDSDSEPLDEHEVRMIRGVFRLDTTVAREIMVPRVDMVAADAKTPITELAEHMVSRGHSRVPVYRKDLDHIEGIAYARDMLVHLLQDKNPSSITVDHVIRPALFIPEAKTLEELLAEFQQRRVHMAIVVDEYGGVSGLVTIEDLLEEIVGEIQDEFDVGEPEIETVSETEFLIDARMGVDQLNELLSVSIEADGFDTLGGLVYQQLGRIPSPGDTLKYDALEIEVVSTVGRSLKRLRVTMPAGSTSSDT